MNNETQLRVLDAQQLAQFELDGFLVLRGVFGASEIENLREHFMAIQARGRVEGYFEPLSIEDSRGDILRQFPRIMHPHRFDEVSKTYLLDARLRDVLHDLFGEESLAAQSMMYFKPPGARGQALHQDNFYLQVSPGTCLAAWVPLDDADEENGGLFVVPGSHRGGIQCPHVADLTQSFTAEEVDVPAGTQAVAVELKVGDVLFFNGSVIHGSYPNTSSTRFRRAFISHYVPASTMEMSAAYYPLHTFDGEKIERGHASGGGVCGTEGLAALHEAQQRISERPQDAVFA